MTNHIQRPIRAHLLRLAVFVCGCILVSLSSPTLAAAQDGAAPDKRTVGGAIAQSPANNQLPVPGPPTGATLFFVQGFNGPFAVTNNSSYTLKSPYNVGGMGAGTFTLTCVTNLNGVYTLTLGTFTATIPVGNGAASFVCPANSTHIFLTCAGGPCSLLFVP